MLAIQRYNSGAGISLCLAYLYSGIAVFGRIVYVFAKITNKSSTYDLNQQIPNSNMPNMIMLIL